MRLEMPKSENFASIKVTGLAVRFVVLVAGCWLSVSATAQDWPRWMGPNGDGVWSEAGIVDSFPEDGPKVVWRIPVNGGYSGPVVADGRVFVTDWIKRDKTEEEKQQKLRGTPGTERVLCVSAETGEEIWTFEHETIYKISYPGGPRSTAWVEGDRVYSLGTMGLLICLNAENGKVHWKKNLAEAYSCKPPVWGFSSHPLIVDDMVICTVGGEGSGVVAMDRITGEEKWKALTAEEIGYAPPVLMEVDGKQQLIVWYDVAIDGLDPKTGDVLWSHKFPETSPQRPSVSIVTPRVIGNKVFVCNFYHGSVLLEVTADGAKQLWSTEGDKKHENDLNTIMTTPVVVDNHLIGLAGNGEIRCVNMDNQKVTWRNEKVLGVEGKGPTARGFAALFFVEYKTGNSERFFIFTDQGELIIAKMSPEGYEQIDSAKLLETTAETRGRPYVWCHPAFADGHMMVRNEKEMICVDLRKTSYN